MIERLINIFSPENIGVTIVITAIIYWTNKIFLKKYYCYYTINETCEYVFVGLATISIMRLLSMIF
jgi:hypothetical protein